MRRTISWSVWDILWAGAGRAPLRSASPLRCDAEPLAQGCAMAAGAGGDSLRDRLRGGRCPAPSSPESVEARLAERPRRAAPSAELTVARAASASAGAPDCPTPRRRLRHSDVTTDRYAPPALNGPSPFVRHDKLRFSIVPFDEYALSASQNWITDSGTRFRYETGGSLVEFAAYTKISWKWNDSCLSSLSTTSPFSPFRTTFVSSSRRSDAHRAQSCRNVMTSKIKLSCHRKMAQARTLFLVALAQYEL